MSRKNSDPNNGANPMLYDPLQEGIGETSKLRQFVAATVGKHELCKRRKREILIYPKPNFTVAMAAVSAGTVLAWTSPVIPQLKAENSSLTITPDQGN